MKKVITLSLCTTLFLTGCSTASFNKNIGKISGTAVGAGVGAAVGKQVAGDSGAIIGALIGGAFGYLIGSEIDERRNAIEKIVLEESSKNKNNKVDVIFNDISDGSGKKVGQSFIVATEKAQFDSGKDELNPQSKDMFVKIAKQYEKSGQSVMIVGHTDSDGSDVYNQGLSERRAKTIAKLFRDNGVKADKIYYKGSGESEPIARNNTEKGKAKNRRVEIVEAPNEEMIAQYALNKKINSTLFDKQKNPNIKLAKSNTNSYINNKVEKVTFNSGKIGTKNDNLAANSWNTKNVGNNIASPRIGAKGGSGFGMPENKLSIPKGTKPLEMSGAKIGIPTLAGKGEPKFKDNDISGNKLFTGVSGNYYVNNKNTSEAIGSCNNEYAYSKNSLLDIKGEVTKINENQLLTLIGHPVKEADFSLVTPAVANENLMAYYGTCLSDKPRKTGNVKKLSTGEVVLAKQNYDLAPALNGSAWGAQVDNEFIMVNPVGVKRSNMQSVSCPEINTIKKGSNQPWYGSSTETISYNGHNGLLLRVYPEDTSKIQCIDIAYPHGNPQHAQGVIYFKNSDGKILSRKTKFFSLDKNGDHI